MVTTFSTQLISHCVNTKIAPISIKEVNKMRFSLLHLGPQVVTTKLHVVNWPLIYFYLILLSLLKSLALVNDYWKVVNTTVTEGSKHFLPITNGVCHFDQKSSTPKSGNLPKIDTQKSGNPKC